MMTKKDLHILSLALEKGLVAEEKLRPILSVSLPKEASFSEFLAEANVLSAEKWQECRQEAQEGENWPYEGEKIEEENSEIYNLLYESGRIDVQFLNQVFSETQKLYKKKEYNYLHHQLIDTGVFNREMIYRILKVQEAQDLTCPKCRYALTIDYYSPWRTYPCLFCSGQLVPVTSKSETVKYQTLPVPEELKKKKEITASPRTPLSQPVEEEEEESRASWREFLAYQYDKFISKGPLAQFISLTTIFLLSLVLCWGLFIAIGQVDDLEAHLWQTFLFLFDPGAVEAATEWSLSFKILTVFTGIVGVVIFSVLIAFLTNAFDQQLEELKKGKSPVIEEGHTLILGWNDKVVSILKELILANESESKAKVVILSTQPKVELEDYLKGVLNDRQTTEIIVRSGHISRLPNLEKVALNSAESIILVSDCPRTATKREKMLSDTQIIKTILSVCKHPQRRKKAFHLVTEVFNPKNIEIAESVGAQEVTILKTNEILGKVIAQTSRQNGLASIYNELFSFDGHEIYCLPVPEVTGKTLGEALFDFPTCIPIGLKKRGQTAQVNPPLETKIEEGDEVILIAEDDSTIYFEASRREKKNFALPQGREKMTAHKEKYLIFGWNDKCENIIEEYDDYLAEGSKIDVVLPEPTEDIRKLVSQLKEKMENVELTLIEKDYRQREDLMSLNPFSYENISILATEVEGHDDIEAIDSQTIYTLLLLRDMQKKNSELNADTRLITEVLDSENQELLQIAQVNDVVISDHLISMMLAQIAEQKVMSEVYEDLLRAEGSEIYLKPAALYFEEFPMEVDFCDILEVAAIRGEIAFGYRLRKWENSPEKSYGIRINPPKEEKVKLLASDQIIVVSEDED